MLMMLDSKHDEEISQTESSQITEQSTEGTRKNEKGQNSLSHVEARIRPRGKIDTVVKQNKKNALVKDAAETGSLVFGLPILQYLVNEETYRIKDDTRTNELVALIVTPTRKLAISYIEHWKIITLVSDMAVRLMDRHSNIIVATPGRCIKFFVLEYARRINGTARVYQSLVISHRYLVYDMNQRLIASSQKRFKQNLKAVIGGTYSGDVGIRGTLLLNEGLSDFPVDQSSVKAMKQRITLARKIDQEEHKLQKKKY
ncbi:12974_t:CDS:2 [Ambispora gerdemannii]|uniref:12974_t:CDS:1 n=1 Tax=Ambispora gerdemannii TaxID=144530 RepID=A0A9N8ZWI0_9GLOM|nr:12974_t:CDS:2 [Ambispora gerdemannii]